MSPSEQIYLLLSFAASRKWSNRIQGNTLDRPIPSQSIRRWRHHICSFPVCTRQSCSTYLLFAEIDNGRDKSAKILWGSIEDLLLVTLSKALQCQFQVSGLQNDANEWLLVLKKAKLMLSSNSGVALGSASRLIMQILEFFPSHFEIAFDVRLGCWIP